MEWLFQRLTATNPWTEWTVRTLKGHSPGHENDDL